MNDPSAPAHLALVGLLAPMPSEMQPLAKALRLQKSDTQPPYRGEIGGTKLVGARTGIGTQRAADATERLLDAAAVEHVMVVGIAGGMGPSQVGDVLYPEVVVERDTGTEYHAHALAGMQLHGRLVTHDDFDMQPDETEALVGKGCVAVDMETAAIARVCEARGVPWSAVRAISDLVGVTPGDVIGLANPDGSPNIGASVKYLVTKPQRIPQLVKLGRDSYRAANAAAHAARDTLARLT
jgi:nucleoside phosphorylase